MGGISKVIGGVAGTGGLGKLVSSEVAAITRGMNLTPTILSSLVTIAEKGDQRAAFNGILTATMANAAKKPNFNLELEINDLFIRLGNLRGMPQQSAEQMMKVNDTFASLSSVLEKLDAVSLAVIKNLK